MTYRIRLFSLVILSTAFITNCASSKLAHRTTQATLWVQNSAEFDALNLQAYQTAEMYLSEAIENKNWTADLNQEKTNFGHLPPAIILDIDETILDNSPYQARMIEKNKDFDIDEWNEWSLEGQAAAIAGAVSLTQKAAGMGIAVFYITNREALTKAATKENMRKLGFPVAGDESIMLAGEQPNWTSSKVERRKLVASKYRIIMQFGDDLNDFLYAKGTTQTQRDVFVRQNADKWGKKWFILPNPIYGSWEQALTDFDNSLTEKEKTKIIENRLYPKYQP